MSHVPVLRSLSLSLFVQDPKLGDTKQVIQEMKRIDDQMRSKDTEIAKYERYLSAVNEELRKESEVNISSSFYPSVCLSLDFFCLRVYFFLSARMSVCLSDSLSPSLSLSLSLSLSHCFFYPVYVRSQANLDLQGSRTPFLSVLQEVRHL